MKIVIAPDSFKGSLTAKEVALAIGQGILAVFPECEIVQVPMADGGEGTVQSLVDSTGGEIVEIEVTGPLGTPVKAFFGLLGDGLTAVIEMASASGLPLVPGDRRNPLLTTTYGTGELIRAALDLGVTNLVIGIGGSATNDGGAGMAMALGARLLDSQGRDLGFGGGELSRLSGIDVSGLDPRLSRVRTTVACDVDNPLCGPRGASAVFGPQKGATPEMVQVLDGNLDHYSRIIERDLGRKVAEVLGAGAAGGLGAGLLAFTNATLRRGVEIVIELTGLDQHLAGASLVITGEGQIDGQTARGKTPHGVAQLAKRHGLPVIAIVGGIGPGSEEVHGLGIDALVPILPRPMTVEEAMTRGFDLVSSAAERTARLLRLAGWEG